MARQKQVFKSSMVAHVWAQQTQEYARNQRGSIYFRGDTIYSYGDHFPIARFVTRKGHRAVLFTMRRHSITTSGHQSCALRALHGLSVPIFYTQDVRDLSSSVKKKESQGRVKEAFDGAVRSRVYKQQYLEEAQKVAVEANQCAEFFGWRWRLPIPELSPEALAKSKAAHAAQRERQKAERAKREAARAKAEAERKARDEEQRAAWLAGATVEYPYPHYGEDALLRVYGDQVQTSRGAEVSVEHAKRLWLVILRQKEKGEPYVRNSHTIRVGHFAVDRIEPNGDIKVGCHYIRFDQILKVARDLGLVEAAAV